MGSVKVQNQNGEKLCLSRVIRTSNYIFKIFSLALIVCVLNVTALYAIETTKASGLVPRTIHGKGQASNSSLPSFQNSCRKLLSLNYVSPKRSDDTSFKSLIDDRSTVPVALGLFLSMRIALIPSRVLGTDQKSRNVQIGPEIRGIISNGNRHTPNFALRIAAFRKCQKEEFLKAGYNNK